MGWILAGTYYWCIFLLPTLPSFPLRQLIGGGLDVTFTEPQVSLHYDSSYLAVTAAADTLAVYFTQLPLIVVTADEALNDKTKVAARFTYTNGSETVSGPIGVEYRGSYSLRFPKKSLDIEFRQEDDPEESDDVTFGNLREDDDWVLDALYNEPLRVNSYVAHKLWLDLHSPSYLNAEEEAKAGADVMHVEVFLRGEYYGVYLLSEQVDRKQLKLKQLTDGEIRGELYKAIQYSGATQFTGQPPLRVNARGEYAGWELKHPDADDTLTYANLYDAVGFVVNSTDSTFVAEAANRFQLDNLRDYFLYVNAASLTDNVGKNAYLARYTSDAPYFYVPWDLDAAFGNNYKGDRDPRTELWITNGLQARLLETNPDGYKTALCDRYTELREGLFAPDSLLARLDRQIAYLKDNGVYTRETLRWGSSVNVSDDQIAYTRQHTNDRIAFLDANVCGLFTPVQQYTAPAAPPLAVFPNPVSGRLYVRHGDARSTAYTLFTTSGRRVASGYLGGKQDSIDLSELPGGDVPAAGRQSGGQGGGK